MRRTEHVAGFLQLKITLLVLALLLTGSTIPLTAQLVFSSDGKELNLPIEGGLIGFDIPSKTLKASYGRYFGPLTVSATVQGINASVNNGDLYTPFTPTTSGSIKAGYSLTYADFVQYEDFADSIMLIVRTPFSPMEDGDILNELSRIDMQYRGTSLDSLRDAVRDYLEKAHGSGAISDSLAEALQSGIEDYVERQQDAFGKLYTKSLAAQQQYLWISGRYHHASLPYVDNSGTEPTISNIGLESFAVDVNFNYRWSHLASFEAAISASSEHDAFAIKDTTVTITSTVVSDTGTGSVSTTSSVIAKSEQPSTFISGRLWATGTIHPLHVLTFTGTVNIGLAVDGDQTGVQWVGIISANLVNILTHSSQPLVTVGYEIGRVGPTGRSYDKLTIQVGLPL